MPSGRAARALGPRLLLILAMGVAGAIGGAAQSELVIAKEGTAQYHRAGCGLVRDAKDVVALTRGQAEARGYKPHPDCDPATRPGSAPGSGADVAGASAAKPQTVYVNDTKYYHRKDCRRLAGNPKSVREESLDTAGKSHWPCPDCRPPVRPRNRTSEPLGRVR